MDEHRLDLVARGCRAAAHAAHLVQAPVEVHDPLVAGALVQAVHVLGQKQLAAAQRFQPDKRGMCSVGPRGADPPPADQAPFAQ